MKKLLLVLVTLSLFLSACGGAAPAAPAAGDAPAADGESVEIRLWGHQAPAFNAANQAMIDAFMEQNPGVTIKYETFPWDVFIQTIQTSLPDRKSVV